MGIEEHPFYVLGVTPRSDRREILDRADGLILQGADPQIIKSHVLQLTHPAKRIGAEVAWFPGAAPSRIRHLVNSIRQDPRLLVGFDREPSGLDSLWIFNSIIYWLPAHAGTSLDAWALALPRLTDNWERIDRQELMEMVNADRAVAGIPQISDLEPLAEALTEHLENAVRSLSGILARSPASAEALNQVIEGHSDGGESDVSDFLAELINQYEIRVQSALQERADAIGVACDSITECIEEGAAPGTSGRDRLKAEYARDLLLKQLDEKLHDWGSVARSIQLLAKSRGLKEPHSLEVANRVRDTAVRLANDFGLHEIAHRITNWLIEVSDHVPEILELLHEDVETLQRLVGTKAAGQRPKTASQASFELVREKSAPIVIETGDGKVFSFPSEESAAEFERKAKAAGGTTRRLVPETAESRREKSGGPIVIETGDGKVFSFPSEEAAAGFERKAKEAGGTTRRLVPVTAPSQSAHPPPEADHGKTAGETVGIPSVESFVEICRSIRLNCWQRIQGNDVNREANLRVFHDAYADYERQVSPWLAIICESYSGNTPVLKRARNEASRCLNSLAGGFICVNHWDSAQKLSREALSLVLGDPELETEINRQLQFIAAEREKSPKPTPPPRTSAAEHRSPEAPPTGKANPPKKSTRTSAWILAAGMAAVFAVLIGIEFISQSATGPTRESTSTGSAAADGTSTPPQDGGSAPSGTANQSGGTAGGWKIVSLEPLPQPIDVKPIERLQKQAAELQRRAAELRPIEPLVVERRPIPTLQLAVPVEEPHEPVSLRNGTELAPPDATAGLGKLKISNYTGHDAAVKLKVAMSRATVRFFYVRANSDVTVSKIDPGEYLLQFATGRDWDAGSLAFRQDRAFDAFDKVLSFSERQVEDGTVYSEHEVTLHAVPNGNIRKRAISAAEFSDDLGGARAGDRKQ